MIALPRTRDFSAGSGQKLLTDNKPECNPLIGVYMALTFFLGAQ
jgi:hypothetical protein